MTIILTGMGQESATSFHRYARRVTTVHRHRHHIMEYMFYRLAVGIVVQCRYYYLSSVCNKMFYDKRYSS